MSHAPLCLGSLTRHRVWASPCCCLTAIRLSCWVVTHPTALPQVCRPPSWWWASGLFPAFDLRYGLNILAQGFQGLLTFSFSRINTREGSWEVIDTPCVHSRAVKGSSKVGEHFPLSSVQVCVPPVLGSPCHCRSFWLQPSEEVYFLDD